jgi:hypothetical protein
MTSTVNNNMTENVTMDIDNFLCGDTNNQLWSREHIEAVNKINKNPDEGNSIYKYMTEEQWNNAHWNNGEGENLPYNCQNKYLQLNGGGKKQWNEERLSNAKLNYTLSFFEIAENKALPDEDTTIGIDWLMKQDNKRSNAQEPLYLPCRRCGSVYIGVMHPENIEFAFDMLGDRINNFEQPQTSFEYRGIYGIRHKLV